MLTVSCGLMDGMVVCRTENNLSDLVVEGITSEKGTVYVSFNGGNEVPCGSSDGNRFTARITTLPVGGPYEVSLRIGNEKISVPGVYVGDVWLLAGQSNMQGNGSLEDAEKNDDPSVRAFYMDDHWDIARDPVCNLRIAKASVHRIRQGYHPGETINPKDPLGKGTGPGVSAAMALHRLTGIPQGIIACAHGATSVSDWDPAFADQGDASLYGAMLDRVRKNGGRVSGVFWYQGENDATEKNAPLYGEKLDGLLAALRKDLHDEELPFIHVQLARVTDGNPAYWNMLRRIQMEFEKRHSRVVTIPVIDLDLEDNIHLRASSCHTLGERFAYAVCTMRGMKGFLPSITPENVFRISGNNDIVSYLSVTFCNVSGSLHAPGRAAGFFLDGSPAKIIRTELVGNEARIYIGSGTVAREVSYGYGSNPYCNITDDAGRSLPCFTLPVKEKYPKTDYIRKMFITDPVLMDDDVRKLTYAMIPEDKGTVRDGAGCWMCSPDREKTPHEPGFRFFRGYYRNAYEQDIRILVGYDGPSKVFCDGVCVHENPDGTNPIIPDQYSIPLHWKPGIHEILVAEVLRNGNTYGISLRLEAAEEKPAFPLPEEWLKN